MAVQGCGGLRNLSAVPDIFLYRFLQIAAAGDGLQDIPRKGWGFLVFKGGDEDAATAIEEALAKIRDGILWIFFGTTIALGVIALLVMNLISKFKRTQSLI